MRNINVRSPRLILLSIAIASLGGCATAPSDMPFSLIDEGTTPYQGTFVREQQKLTAQIGNRTFEGSYMVSNAVSYSQSTWPMWSRWPIDRTTTTFSNSARAHLSTADGESLSCEFLFEPPRAMGQCKSNKGKTYQLIAKG